MSTTQPPIVRRFAAPVGSAFVIMVADEPCVVRATGVRPIADVLAPPEAEVLGWEEMASLGVLDTPDTAIDAPGGMIIAPRARRRRERSLSSRAMLLGRPRG